MPVPGIFVPLSVIVFDVMYCGGAVSIGGGGRPVTSTVVTVTVWLSIPKESRSDTRIVFKPVISVFEVFHDVEALNATRTTPSTKTAVFAGFVPERASTGMAVVD